VSRRGPGRPKVLTEDEVADAATSIAREQGIARLSMRAVARHLGVPPMTVYGYVPSKEALEVLVIDRILGEVHIPGPDEGPWDVRLCRMLGDARRILVERPHLGDQYPATGGGVIALLHRGAFGHEASRLAAGVYDLLRQGGFGDEHLEACFGALFLYVTGFVDPDGGDPAAGDHATTEGSPGGRPPSEIFDIGLAALIAGLQIWAGLGPSAGVAAEPMDLRPAIPAGGRGSKAD